MSTSLGEHFQRAREAKGLTLDEAAARTRILPQYLQAVEENNYAKLPDEVFAKGFVRSYARLLGLDEGTVIRQFDESGGQFYAKRAERESLKQKLEEEERRKKTNRNIVIGMVAAALLILFVLMGRDRDRGEPRSAPEPAPPISTPAPAPTPAQPSTPAPAPESPRSELPPPPAEAGGRTLPGSGQAEVERNFSGALPLEGIAPDVRRKLVLDVEAVERCWIKVQADQAGIQEVLLNPGERMRWKAQDRMIVTLGNAGGVRVSLNGKLQGPYGGSGQVVKEIVFTP